MSLTEDQRTYVQRTFRLAALVAKETDYVKANALTEELGGPKLEEGLSGTHETLVCMMHATRQALKNADSAEPKRRATIDAIMQEPGFEDFIRDIVKTKTLLLDGDGRRK